MPANKKPEADWPRIHERYCAEYLGGTISLRQLAREEKVSHPTIIERAQRDGWGGQPTTVIKKATEALPTYQPQDALPTEGRSKDSPARRERIIADFKAGYPVGVVCARNGISDQTLRNWKKEDESFALAILEAESNLPAKAIDAVVADIKRGNGALAMKVLERHPMSKSAFAEDKSGGGININLNIPLPGTVQTIEPVTIDQPKDQAA